MSFFLLLCLSIMDLSPNLLIQQKVCCGCRIHFNSIHLSRVLCTIVPQDIVFVTDLSWSLSFLGQVSYGRWLTTVQRMLYRRHVIYVTWWPQFLLLIWSCAYGWRPSTFPLWLWSVVKQLVWMGGHDNICGFQYLVILVLWIGRSSSSISPVSPSKPFISKGEEYSFYTGHNLGCVSFQAYLVYLILSAVGWFCELILTYAVVELQL